MQVFRKIRVVFIVLILLWALSYLPVTLTGGMMNYFAPLSTSQIPLVPIFYGVNFGYVLYALFFLFCLVSALLTLREKFAAKIWPIIAPLLLCAIDVLGQIFSFQAISFELYEDGRLEAYYYFNHITPPAPWFFLVAIAVDLIFMALLLLPPVIAVRGRIRAKKAAPAEEQETPGVIATDNWSEILSTALPTQDFAPSVDEAYKTECEKK